MHVKIRGQVGEDLADKQNDHPDIPTSYSLTLGNCPPDNGDNSLFLKEIWRDSAADIGRPRDGSCGNAVVLLYSVCESFSYVVCNSYGHHTRLEGIICLILPIR